MVKKKIQKVQVRNTGFGLKEISNRVREIIKRVGTTSYKEISDEIVNEINEKNTKDEKNIRRRIYDSLNVMKSMKLFKKDRLTKKISWNYLTERSGQNFLKYFSSSDKIEETDNELEGPITEINPDFNKNLNNQNIKIAPKNENNINVDVENIKKDNFLIEIEDAKGNIKNTIGQDKDIIKYHNLNDINEINTNINNNEICTSVNYKKVEGKNTDDSNNEMVFDNENTCEQIQNSNMGVGVNSGFGGFNVLEDNSKIIERINNLKNDIKNKKSKLNLLEKEFDCLKIILERNKNMDSETPESKKIYFPFIIIELPEKSNYSDSKIKISMDESKTQAHFAFDSNNKLYGDLDAILKIGKNINMKDYS